MNNRFLIPSDRIDEDDLGDLVASIRSVTQAEAYVEKQFVVTSDNPVVLDALKALFGDLQGAMQPRKARKTKAKPAVKKPRGRYVKAWEYVSGCPIALVGTKMNASELQRRLADHAIEVGSVLRHPKHGLHQVEVSSDGENGPFILDKVEQS
jgi:hypothetical protein